MEVYYLKKHNNSEIKGLSWETKKIFKIFLRYLKTFNQAIDHLPKTEKKLIK